MPRPLIGRVGRSAGVAEHRVARHRCIKSLARTTAPSRAIALACVVALAMAGAPSAATAQTSAGSLAQTRAAIDKTANQWFAAQRRANDLELKIQTLTNLLSLAERQVAELRGVADARVVQLYETGTQALEGMMGGDPLEVGRRAELISHANANGQRVIDQWESSISDLAAKRSQLHSARKAQVGTLRELAGRRHQLDSELAALQLRSANAAGRTQLAAEIRRAAETAADPTRPAVAELSTPVAGAAAPVAAVPAAPVDTGAVNPHHNDPFLACTRARESNGDYSVVSAGGSYYGAYQFAPTTWDVTAAHTGRLDLVGVLPSAASPYDQDEMAWTLYRWQGNSPWGGRC